MLEINANWCLILVIYQIVFLFTLLVYYKGTEINMDECVIMDEYLNIDKYATLISLKTFYYEQMHIARRN